MMTGITFSPTAIEHSVTEIIESSGLPPIQEGNAVQFRLLYQGPLRANGSVEDKFRIRRQLHAQLRRLWAEHPVLHDECERLGAAHSSSPSSREEAVALGIRALADSNINGFTFLPLSKPQYFLRCSLDVLFLRREKPGRVWMHGDIDNRLKTLFDALQMPHSGQEIGKEVPREEEDPFFVLLQEDEMIADVAVTTDRLLVPFEREYSGDYVVLVLNVRLQPTQRAEWWHVF